MESSKPFESSSFGERSNDDTLAKEGATSVESQAVSSSLVAESVLDIVPPQISESDDAGGPVKGTRDETSQNSDSLVTFKITDSNGSAIPNVYIKINPNTLTQRTTRYSDQNGVITYSFSKFGLGKHSIDIVEGYKIKKEIQYEINIEKFPAEVNLIWDFGNPDKIKYIPKNTEVELQIVDKDDNLRIYDITTSSNSGNTDYHFSWGDVSIKH